MGARGLLTRIRQFNWMTCAGRGVSLEQRTHRPVMLQSFFVTGTSLATVEDPAHRTDLRNCAQRHRPVAFAAEGLRLALCFAFNCGIRFCYFGSYSFLMNPLLSSSAMKLGSINSSGLWLRISGRVNAT